MRLYRELADWWHLLSRPEDYAEEAAHFARALEAEDLEGVLGTIAGDDTVLVMVATEAAGEGVRQRISELT